MNRRLGSIRGFVLVMLPLLVLCFLLLLLSGNTAVTVWVNQHHHPVLDQLFSQITLLGDWVLYIVVMLYGWRSSRKHAVVGIVALAVSGLIISLLKHQVFPERKRPSAALVAGSIREVPTVPLHQNNSFPSGHTATAFTGFCSLALFSRKAAAQAFFAILAAMVAYSRMYLGQHFMSDVLAGAVIGTAVALAVDWIFELWQPRWLQPHQA